uniref:Uncharacterized protein n=1 Tax=Oryza brachyantha TaxID=4533 RepID=J3KZR0_ORYBR
MTASSSKSEEKIEIALDLSDIDETLTELRPTEPEDPVSEECERDEDFNKRVKNNEAIRMKYDVAYVKWESSNLKCLMVVKSSIVEAIRKAILACTTAVEYP